MRNNFEVINVEMRDIAVANAQQFFELGLRRTHPVALLCKLPTLKHTSVIRCAPLNTYFCGIREYPTFDSALHAYTSTHLIPSDSFYEGFLGEMRKNGIKKDLLPRNCFAHYSQWGGYGSQMKDSFGMKFVGTALDKRVESAFVPDEMVDRVIEHWGRQFEQFGAVALHAAPEALNAMVAEPLFSENIRLSKVPYRSADYGTFGHNVFLDPHEEEWTSVRLKQMVDELERGEAVVPDLFPLHMVKSVPSVYLRDSHAYPSPAWDRAQLRAKLIRLLGSVWHYPSALIMYENLKDKPLRANDGRNQVLDEILSNLEKYLSDIRTKYPVINENPFA